MPPTIIADVLGTGNIQSAQRIVDMDDMVHQLDPNATALTALLMKLAKKPTINPKYDQLTDEFRPLNDTINGAQTDSDTAIEVDNGSYWRAGDLAYLPETKELLFVVSVAANTLTVATRPWGEAAKVAISDADEIWIVGNAFEEGAGKPAIRTTKKGTDFNYTEIFREPFGSTGTQENSSTYGNEGIAGLRKKHGIEHMLQIERAFWFGQRKEDTSGTHPKRATRGVMQALLAAGSGAATKDAGGAFTDTEMEDFLRDLFRYGSDTKFLFASRLAMSVISNSFAQGKLQMFPEDQVYGISITSYLSPHGMAKLITNNLFTGTGTDKEFGGWIVALDLMDLNYRFLQNRDTKLYVNRQANDVDGTIDEYLTECGLQLNHPRFHGYVKGITG